MIHSHLDSEHKIGLLVSVRDEMEAEIVRKAKVDILDVKEPKKGSLGRPDTETLRKIVRNSKDETISVALGELHELNEHTIVRFFADCGDHSKIQFAKIGLSTMSLYDDWEIRWRQCVKRFPQQIRPVAVVYVDEDEAKSPPFENIAKTGTGLGCEFLLLDTFRKNNGNLFDHWPVEKIQRCQEWVATNGLNLIVAGSLNIDLLPIFKTLRPDFIGIRGAACDSSNRNSSICSKRLYEFTLALGKI